MDETILSMYKRLADNKVSEDAPTVQHQVPDVFFRDEKSRKPIGYTIFEMTKTPASWARHCNQKVSTIWTGSEYSRQAFLNGGVNIPVEVLPHALDLDAYSPDGPKWKIENRRGFAFLSIFDFTERKAWRELLRAWWNAFDSNDDVCLILKVYFGNFSDDGRKDIVRRIAKYRMDLKIQDWAPILIYGHDVRGTDMPSLYRSADCYVGISREGFGLPFSESMACGIPCIGPEVGGTRQYMTQENSWLVKYDREEPIDSELVHMFPSFDGLSWSVHSWEHLAELMRHVVEDDEDRKNKSVIASRDIRHNLSYEKIGNRIKELLY
jgi:glycosyltransferase involved in cell wall biosynthesis